MIIYAGRKNRDVWKNNMPDGGEYACSVEHSFLLACLPGMEKYLLGTLAASTRLSLQIPGEFRNEERENANIAYRIYNWAKIWLNIEIRVKLLVNFSLEFHSFFKRRANEQTLLFLPYTNYQYFIIFKGARVKHSRKHIFNREFHETANNPHARKTGRKSEREWRASRAS